MFCDLSLQCQVLPERFQLTQDKSRQIRHIWEVQGLPSSTGENKIRDAWTWIKLTPTKSPNIFLPALIQLVCRPARDLQKKKKMFGVRKSPKSVRKHLSGLRVLWVFHPKGRFFPLELNSSAVTLRESCPGGLCLLSDRKHHFLHTQDKCKGIVSQIVSRQHLNWTCCMLPMSAAPVQWLDAAPPVLYK